MFYIIDYLKAFACLLIVNFHSDILFPDRLSLFAFGGDLGNNIFFMVSGFALYPSIRRTEYRRMGRWYGKRLKRLLPMLFLFYAASLAVGDVRIGCVSDIITAFVFPSIYWFTGAILLLYFVLFVLEKGCPAVVRNCMYVIFSVLHIILDGIYVERYLIGFMAMAVGSGMRRRFEQETCHIEDNRCFIMGTLSAGIVYVILKFLRKQGVQAFGLVHLGIGLATISIAALLLGWGYLKENSIKRFSACHNKFYRIVHVLAKVTLAVYLVQGFHNRIILQCIKKHILFPVSYVLGMTVVFIFAVIISKVDEFFHKRMDSLWRAWRYRH